MDIHAAVLRAADHIERNPHLYDFCSAHYTPGPSDKACLVGRVAFFAGEAPGQACGTDETDVPLTHRLFGVSFKRFADRIKPLVLAAGGSFNDPNPAAAALRAYAAKYLKPQQQPPDWQVLAQRLAAQEPIAA